MDLTNIKPCVACANRWKCEAKLREQIPWVISAMFEIRGRKILIFGEDCFEEGDNGNL